MSPNHNIASQAWEVNFREAPLRFDDSRIRKENGNCCSCFREFAQVGRPCDQSISTYNILLETIAWKNGLCFAFCRYRCAVITTDVMQCKWYHRIVGPNNQCYDPYQVEQKGRFDFGMMCFISYSIYICCWVYKQISLCEIISSWISKYKDSSQWLIPVLKVPFRKNYAHSYDPFSKGARRYCKLWLILQVLGRLGSYVCAVLRVLHETGRWNVEKLKVYPCSLISWKYRSLIYERIMMELWCDQNCWNTLYAIQDFNTLNNILTRPSRQCRIVGLYSAMYWILKHSVDIRLCQVL